MKTSELKKYREKSATWPTFVRTWDEIPTASSSLVVDRKLAKSLEPLANYRRLKHLFVHGLRAQDVEHLSACQSLKALLIWRLDSINLRWLSPVSSLESLGVYHAPKLKSLDGLGSIHSLRHIFFHHIPLVRSLEPLRDLTNLEEIVIEQSWATNKPLSFHSLEPLGKLDRLACLDLRGVEVLDGSLKPIASRPAIRWLFPCSYSYDIHKLAFLAAKLNHRLAREDRIYPVIKPKPDDSSPRCKKCGTQLNQLVGKVGAKYRLHACPKCDKDLIAERIAIFKSYS